MVVASRAPVPDCTGVATTERVAPVVRESQFPVPASNEELSPARRFGEVTCSEKAGAVRKNARLIDMLATTTKTTDLRIMMQPLAGAIEGLLDLVLNAAENGRFCCLRHTVVHTASKYHGHLPGSSSAHSQPTELKLHANPTQRGILDLREYFNHSAVQTQQPHCDCLPF